MYVKKFSADTLEEALKMIKNEMGPDAIILKTEQSKGIKGAFKKKKIEITAAVSEREYKKKQNVDVVLGDDGKNAFYKNPATEIADKIENYSFFNNKGERTKSSPQRTTSPRMESDLDKFLESGRDLEPPTEMAAPTLKQAASTVMPQTATTETPTPKYPPYGRTEERVDYAHFMNLEKKVQLLEESILVQEVKIPKGLYRLKTALKCQELSDEMINNIQKKAIFELKKEDLEDYDLVLDLALRELNKKINTYAPLFTDAKVRAKPVVTLLIAPIPSGQTSAILKMAKLRDDTAIIGYKNRDVDEKYDFAKKMFNLNYYSCDNSGDLLNQIRKVMKEGKQHVIIDYKTGNAVVDESKKIIDELKKVYDHVEVLITLSAIHSEKFNRKCMTRYKDLIDGVVVTYLDLCLNYGDIINTHSQFTSIPLKCYSIGDAIPDDFELATSERLISGIFDL